MGMSQFYQLTQFYQIKAVMTFILLYRNIEIGLLKMMHAHFPLGCQLTVSLSYFQH